MFVLDTNTVIYFFQGRGGIAVRLLDTAPSAIGLSAIVLFELETGIAKSSAPSRRRRQLDMLVEAATLLPFGSAEARAAAEARSVLERAGTPIGPLDNLIAGTAIAAGGTLVTRNVDEFSRIPGLRVVNWYDQARD